MVVIFEKGIGFNVFCILYFRGISFFVIILMKFRVVCIYFFFNVVKMFYFEVGDEIVDFICEFLEFVVVDLIYNDFVVVSVGV